MSQLQTQPVLPATAHGISDRDAVAAALALAAEAVVALLGLSSDVPLLWTVMLHFATVLFVGLMLFMGRDRADDKTVAFLMILAIAVAGPAGAIASLAALAFVDHAGAGPHVLDAWYDRLTRASHADAASELTDRVTAGRVLRADASRPEVFEDVIAHGTLQERQAALGLMARHFHTDFAPALQAALRSEEPVVRVQAAAVVAKVRADLKARIKMLIGTQSARSAPVPDASLNAAAELSRLADCPLVDGADAERCRKTAADALKISLVTGRDVRAAAMRANAETAPVIERFLMASGRYGEFRVARRIHALVADRAYRVRLLESNA